MGSGRLLVAAAALLLPGCLAAIADPIDAPYGWSVRMERSMLPHFPGDDDETYPIVVVHSHVAESAREAEEYRTGKRTRVVCFTLDDVAPAPTMDSASMSMAADAPCLPVYDAGTGRLFAAAEEFAQTDPWAVAVVGGGCGRMHPLAESSPGLFADAPGHRFRVEFLHNETLKVDAWYVEPGHSLKVDYVDPGADERARDDDRAVTFVFDYPGRWLRSRVGAYDGQGPIQGRPPEGDGPEAWVPRTPFTVAEILDPLVRASPGGATELVAFRATMVQGRLTDLSVHLSGERSIRWFVAGGTDGELRMLGATAKDEPASRVALEWFLEAFQGTPFKSLAGPTPSDASVEVRWEPKRGLRSIMPVPWSETWVPTTEACHSSCRFVWAKDPFGVMSWRPAERSDTVEGENQLSLLVRVFEGPAAKERLFFRPS